jgi:DNA helicase II / ATP-dependent DNA helicase PcrA
VSLMTVHSAKGLEFRTVFLTGMEEEIFPYRGLDSDELEELDEERRLAYVAITRARERLHITHASTRTLFGKTRYLNESRFLADMPHPVVQRVGAPWSSPGASPHQFSSSSSPWRQAPPSAPPQPMPQPGERVIDREAFDDIVDQDDASPNRSARPLRPGTPVQHKRFGRGVIERIEAPSVLVRFPGYGTRRILAEYLQQG